MAKFSGTPPRPRGGSTISTRSRSSKRPDTRTAQGGAGFSKDVKSELFSLAVTNFVSEDTFYESASDRDARFLALIQQATTEDPQWTADLLYWLRSDGNMRSASIMGAVEYGRALAHTVQGVAGGQIYRTTALGERTAVPMPRTVLDRVMQRADEPGEALGYWLGAYGRPLPKWFKKALGDGAERLYTEYNTFKYDGQGKAIRFGDVVEFSQVPGEHVGWKWLLARRHNRENLDQFVEQLPMLAARREMDAVPLADRRARLTSPTGAELLQRAGQTWEAISGWIQGPMDKDVWEAIIPQMGYMALLRNLRNFDEAGVSDEVAAQVMAKLTDPEQVARSRQLPFRFLSAYLHAPSDRYKHALGHALDLSLANVPSLTGRTLVLIDTSGSMGGVYSSRSSVPYWQTGALFGLALAKAQQESADIFGFDTSVRPFKLTKGASTLAELTRFEKLVTGGGTYTKAAVEHTYDPKRHQRVVVLTDAQAAYDGMGVFDRVPEAVPCYTFDISGYTASHDISGTATRRAVAGLTDSAFKMMNVLEAHHGSGQWPWQSGE